MRRVVPAIRAHFRGAVAVQWLIVAMLVVQYLQVRIFVNAGADWEARIFYQPDAWQTRPWALITSTLAHNLGPGWHLERNAIGLLLLGPIVERAWGAKWFVAYFFVAGAITSIVLNETRLVSTLGASGAVYALIGPWLWSVWPQQWSPISALWVYLGAGSLGLVGGLDRLWHPGHLMGYGIGLVVLVGSIVSSGLQRAVDSRLTEARS